ncbi:MAG: PDZ domain-containing protein [Cyanobacteria bacterium P01_F01_bin.33]
MYLDKTGDRVLYLRRLFSLRDSRVEAIAFVKQDGSKYCLLRVRLHSIHPEIAPLRWGRSPLLNCCRIDRGKDDVMTFSFKPKRRFARRVGATVATVAASVGLTVATLHVCPNLLPNNAESNVSAQGGTAPEPFVGIQIHDLTPNLARRMNGDRNARFIVPEIAGVAIFSVVPDSPAARGGLRRGDVVTRIDGTDIQSARELKEWVERSDIGQSLRLEVRRGNTLETLTVRPGDVHQFFD